MLAKLTSRYVIVGHSERRELFGETDEMVEPKKLRAVLAHGMTPILCVGETLEEREAGVTDEKVRGQVRAAFAGLGQTTLRRCVVAYEPIWAIGTGRNATPDDAERRRSASIRSTLRHQFAGRSRREMRDPVRREREARQHRRAHGDAGDRRWPRRRRLARSRRLRPDHPVRTLIDRPQPHEGPGQGRCQSFTTPRYAHGAPREPRRREGTTTWSTRS